MKKTIKCLALLLLLISNLTFAQEITKPQKKTLKRLNRKAIKAYSSYNYKNAIKYSSDLIDEATLYNDFYYKFLGYNLIGNVYRDLEDSTKATINNIKALEIAKESKADTLIAWGHLNLAITYSDNKKTYKQAIQSFNKSIVINEKLTAKRDLHLIYINLAWTYLENNQEEEAFVILKKAKAISNEIRINSEDETYIDFLLGHYYFIKKDYKKARENLEFSAKKVEKDSLVDLGKEVFEVLSNLNFETENYREAFLNLKKKNYYNEKVYTLEKIEENEKAIAKFSVKESEKDLKIALKEKDYSRKKTTIFITATVVLFIALLGFFLLLKSRKKLVNKLTSSNSDLIKSKEEAEKLSKVKAQFFSTVSHELRTPLYGVVGISSILQEDKNLKLYEEELNSLKFSADYLLALINDVLLLNKMDYEDLVLEKVPFELKTLVNSIAKSFEYSLQQNKNKLIVDIDEKVPDNLIGSSVRISQILMNLIGNATKFNENGNIWLTIKFQEKTDAGLNRILFVVKDDGIGIPKDKQESIFKEFSQVVSNNYSHKGTGLGLSIVKKLLQLHNSDIHLESDIGKGTTFSFTLDLQENPNAESSLINKEISSEELRSALTSKHQNIHVLVVDDNKINQKVTQGILKKNNIQSSLANDGQEAVDLVKANTYSLILMDINMPKINGIEATKMIRVFNKDIPIIALTAIEIDEMRVKILASGMNGILSKPYDASVFLSTILRNL